MLLCQAGRSLILRPSAAGLLCDLLWADPDKEIQGWGENDRGVSYTFGPDSVSEFLTKHDLDLVCRAHQVSSSAPAGAAAKPTGAACCFLICMALGRGALWCRHQLLLLEAPCGHLHP